MRGRNATSFGPSSSLANEYDEDQEPDDEPVQQRLLADDDSMHLVLEMAEGTTGLGDEPLEFRGLLSIG